MAQHKSRIKILLTIPNFDTAGSGKVLFDLAKGLNCQKYEVHIACKHDRGEFYEMVKKLGYPIHLIETSVPLRPYFSLFFRLNNFKKFVKQNNFEIVHSWNWSSDWTELVGSRLGGAKFIFTKKSMSWGNWHWRIKSFLSSSIITVNEDMRSFFPFKKNQTLIPFGINLDQYYSIWGAETDDRKKFEIITVANLVPVKSIENLIRALGNVDNPEIVLKILGDDNTEYAAELKELVIELSMSQRVEFLGKRMDVRTYLANSDLYVISSKMEGMPMALVEAMTMGLPVIGANSPGINYVLNDFPKLLYEFEDIPGLCRKIEWIYNMDLETRMQLGNQLRQYSIHHFSMSRFIKEHEDLYSSIARIR